MLKQGCNLDGEPLRDFYVEHDPVDLDCQAANDGMTRQEFKDECDINVLMAGYFKTGLSFNDKPMEFLDVSDVPDLMSSISYMERAESAFMTLTAQVRREFDNDAVKFVEYASNPANVERMREWGLAAPKAPEPPPVAVPETTPKAGA